MLLLTSGVSKWADLSDNGDRALAGVQLALSSGVGFLLLAAVVMAAVKIIRGLHRNYTTKKAAEAAAEAGGDGNEEGGEDGEAAGRKSVASIKRGSLGDGDAAGEISAIGTLPGRPDSRTFGGSSAGAAGAAPSKPILTGKSGRQLATIKVVAGNPLYEPEAAASPYADNTPQAK